MFRKILLLSLLAAAFGRLDAQSLWSDVSEQNLALSGERRIVPRQYRTVRLDLDAAQSLLAAAPERFKSEAADNQTLLTLPTPDGGWQSFLLYESPVMAPALQANYPDIRCYTGIGLDDPSATLKCDLTPWGFHAMVFSAQNGTMFIDPYSHGDRDNYVVYFKKDYPAGKNADFTCFTEEGDIAPHPDADGVSPDFQGDCQLRQYRLALACTGEYATFHGGTKPLVLAAMNTTMNRVNGVYETDLAITMQIIANNDLIIFLNAATDPYTNNDGGTMLGQNITTCNNVIGIPNYDIGHVFSTGGGGVAGLQVVCTNNKARGVTGGGSPIGDAFDIDYVAHEMGHQFGANHTQNNNCNRVAGSAMEPGSASTIMGYAGICNPNVQNNSDDYFHAISLQQIGNFVIGAGHTCPVEINTGNNAPTVNAGADYTIPKSTPFRLTATGSDQDNDPLTYCWEQMDPEFAAVMPPAATNLTGPMFRSYKGTASPIRWFPRQPDLIANINSTWEELPSVARTMKFRVTARDNHAGAGCTEEDDVVLTVSGTAGPFVVSEPNTNVLWYVNEIKTVTWNVASTNAAPVNCANVRLLLSTDGGLTYPIILLNSTANDGSADVTVPNNLSNNCRVMVQSIGNIFFDISNVNFRIQTPPVATFTLTTVATLNACAGEETSFAIDLAALAGFDSPVQLSVSGVPAGATLNITPNPLTPSGSATVTISNITPAMAGIYTLTVQGIGDTITQTASVELTVLPGAPTDFAELSLPADGATGVPVTVGLEWEAVPFAAAYQVEVATNPGFDIGALVFMSVTAGTTAIVAGLESNTVYYWRVIATSPCGDGEYSAISAFLTANLGCDMTFTSTNVPVAIDPASENTVTSTLNIPISINISDVNVGVLVNHSWVGDLDASLSSPSGTMAQLFDQPGVPASDFGCSSDNVAATFDDEAAQTAAELEIACAVNPAIGGEFQSITPLSVYDNINAQGQWTLSVTDNYPEDGGSIVGWSLSFCIGGQNLAATLATNAPLTLLAGNSATITSAYLAANLTGTAAQGVFTVLVLPEFGQLYLNGNPLGIGGTFTQADVNAGLLSYQHDGSAPTSDNFHFDFTDQNNGAWLHDGIFNFIILQNTLVTSAAQTQGLACFGETTGQITVTASGGTNPLSYSLNGGPAQGNNVFSNLAAGTYTVVVTDNNGFTSAANAVTIADPAALSVSAAAMDDDVTVTASGGTGTLEYSLDGQNFQASNVFENLSNGVYTVTVQDANGCTATASVIVAVNTLVVALAQQTGVSCADGNDGALVVSVGGGTAPLTYSLNGGTAQAGNVFSGLSAGTYSVVVTDAESFTATTNVVILANPSVISVSTSTTDDDVTVTATGGTGTLTYSIDGQNFQASNVFADLSNGVYTITVQDANGCTASETAIVAVNTLLAALAVEADISCAGGNNGALVVTVGGGQEPYTFSLNGGPAQGSPVFIGLPAGTYTVVVLDALSFPATTNDVILTAPSAIDASASVNLSTVTITASGGTGVLTYSLDGVDFQASNVFTGLANGVYTVVVQDANGCTATVAATVDVPPLTYGVDITPNLCAGEQNAMFSITVSGGAPPFTYSLNGGAFQSSNEFTGLAAGTYQFEIQDAQGITPGTVSFNDPSAIIASASTNGNVLSVTATGGTGSLEYSLDGMSFQSSNVFNGLANGTYTVTVRDGNGCTVTTTATVTSLPLAFFSTEIFAPNCFGGSDGVLIVTPIGGVTPYEYSLNNGPWQTDSIFTGIGAGLINIRIRDAAGTIVDANIVISEPNLMLVVPDVFGNDVVPSISGGTPPYTMQVVGQPDLIDLPNGDYTLIVTDANGCTVSEDFVVDYTPLSGTFSLVGDPCTSNDILITAAGGVPGYEYSVNNGPYQPSPQFNNLAPGPYSFTIRDIIGDVYTIPGMIVLSEPLSVGAVSVNSTVTAQANGGTGGPFQYSLGNSPFQDSPIFTGVANGVYTLVVLDVTGCTASTQVTVMTIGTFDPAAGWGLLVTPNPSQGLFQLSMQNAPAATFRTDVFDATGRLLQTRTFTTNGASFNTSLDLLGFPQGIYLLRLTDGTNWGTVRLSVIR